MARKPHTPETPEVEPGDVPGNAITLSEEASIRNDDAERAFDAARALGQIEAARFSAQCAEKVMVEVFIKLKENKAYRAVMITDDSGNRRRCADLEEFCEHHLGSSYSKLKELTANYNLLGADLFEQAERLGFRRNDYRALKALPAEDQDVIKQAMQPESGRDQIIDLLQEMAARHASEKAALTAQAKEAEDTAEARSEVISAKESKINALEEANHLLKRKKANFTDIEQRDYECAPLHDTINETMLALAKMEREVARLTQEVGGELIEEEVFHAVLLAVKRALEINDKYRLNIDQQSLFIDVSGLELRAAGLNPEALQ